jgi:comEA protein
MTRVTHQQEDTMTRRVALFTMFMVLGNSFGSLPAMAQSATPPAPTRAELINLNTSTAAQLALLPGIGPKTAELIIQYRQKAGGFKKIEEIMNVRGVGEKSFLRIRNLISVTPPKFEQ